MPPTHFHPQALVESPHIGEGTRVWAFAHVLPGARIGRECNICDGVFIEGDVVVGDRVTIKCGVQLWNGVTVEDDVFIGPNATFTNDRFPRSKQHPASWAKTLLRAGCSIGANATILPGVEIGKGAMVGAGSVVTHHVPSHAIVVGNPARITGYTDSAGRDHPMALRADGDRAADGGSRVQGVQLVPLKRAVDIRGSLVAGEFGQGLPFPPKRFFLVMNVPSGKIRGEHAHHECWQFLICVNGSVSVMVDNGEGRDEFRLDRPDQGLLVPPLVWASQFRHSPDALLLVLASHAYDPDDYIRDYDRYISVLKEKANRARLT